MTKSLDEMLSGIEAAYAKVLYRLNGNSLRQVSGSLYNSEFNAATLMYQTNTWLDQRQERLLSSVGEVLSPETQPITSVNEISIESAIAGKPLSYKFSFKLAFAYELLHYKSLSEQRRLLFITVQLSERECLKLKTAGGFRGLQRKVRGLLTRPDIDAGFGFVVFEKTERIQFDSGENRYHFHAVCSVVNSKQAEKQLREALRSISHATASSVQIIGKRRYRRFKGDERVMQERGLDLGLADYLSKRLAEPLVEGVKNIILIGINTELTALHKVRFKQSRALKITLGDLKNEVRFERYTGDAERRFEDALANFEKIKTTRSEAA